MGALITANRELSVDDEAAGELLAALFEVVDGHAPVLEAAVQVGEGVEQRVLVDGCALDRVLALVLEAGGATLGLVERLLLLVALPLELPECGAAVGHGYPLPVDGLRGTPRRRIREEDAATHVVGSSHASHSSYSFELPLSDPVGECRRDRPSAGRSGSTPPPYREQPVRPRSGSPPRPASRSAGTT